MNDNRPKDKTMKLIKTLNKSDARNKSNDIRPTVSFEPSSGQWTMSSSNIFIVSKYIL